MRMILIDWLIEVHRKFDLNPETLYLTINIVDRFLSLKQIRRRELQLVGISAMLIASKYEEIWAPEVSISIWTSKSNLFNFGASLYYLVLGLIQSYSKKCRWMTLFWYQTVLMWGNKFWSWRRPFWRSSNGIWQFLHRMFSLWDTSRPLLHPTPRYNLLSNSCSVSWLWRLCKY